VSAPTRYFIQGYGYCKGKREAERVIAIRKRERREKEEQEQREQLNDRD
jgi:hypothetical protein